ncbi:ABC transporter substrate-binding protein [Dongia sedimenti]|uniref:ABC transporter substrate-binding protein n=1 Tax=Dongia sedimenti TaxID=3064282 RepID=A0ABU0YUL5_9PROT|nr:ABC transporter substrate-binding protein [Rhodospirillaceae bacterium R-7]
MAKLCTFVIAVLSLISLSVGQAQAGPEVRVGTLQFGTVNWELGVIGDGIDRKHGFTLKPVVLADKDATSVALLSGDVDAIVTDWIWVAKQRSLGRDFTFVPFSRSVGALMVDPAKGYKSLADLKGKRLGVAGGASDKSWVLLRAYAMKTESMDIVEAVDAQFGAPPMLNELVLRDKLDGVLNFWNFNARLKEKGLVPLITIGEILPALGIKTAPPLLGWVFSEKWAKDHPDLANGLIDASYEAKHAMKTDDALWQRLRPKMDAESDSLFEILKAGYREGIPEGYSEADVTAASEAFALMRDIDKAAVGGLDALPAGTFWPSYRP